MLIDGYSITQYPKENRIVITLPQRLDTPVSTILPVSERRMMLSDAARDFYVWVMRYAEKPIRR